MIISEVIEMLEKAKEEWGDIKVYCSDSEYGDLEINSYYKITDPKFIYHRIILIE